jgi:hypothetical protein
VTISLKVGKMLGVLYSYFNRMEEQKLGKYFENDENQNSKLKTFKSGATRSEDAEAERFDLISPFAMRRMARIMAEGAETHGDANWELGVPLDATLNHLERHLQLWKEEKKSGKKIGKDDHMAKVAWGAFAIMHYEVVGPLDYGSLVPYTEFKGKKVK